jgi:hypothetical protein
MATVIPRLPFDRAATDRRVRHPLHSLRGYIRTYVVLEGAAVAFLYLALWFWIGLALDYGPFRLFAFDWVQELNAAVDPGTAFLVRAVLLGALVLGLVAVVAFKVVTRLLREFSDPALALVLERRFPRELGDRLITAVELADPKVGDKYGYSQALIDHTIQDAADRVERVPVRQVFNWGRLSRQWLTALVCSLGVYLLVFLCYAGYAIATESSAGDFYWRFNNVAAIWAERDVLLLDTYWPRRAYLEVLRFQDAEGHRGEMRVARDEQRPDLLVRAYQWVVADHKAEGGWRPLYWKDVPGLVEAELLDFPLGADYTGWAVDLDELDPSVPAGAVPPEWNGQRSGAFHELFKHKDPRGWARGRIPSKPFHLQDIYLNVFIEVGGKKLPSISTAAVPAIQRLLDWHDWTMDKIALQLDQPEVRRRLRRFEPAAYAALEKIFTRLAELADDPAMARRLRKLEIPDQVLFSYRGKTTKGEVPHKREEGNKYLVGLGDLKESVRFTVRGEDYYTPTRTITLVPPPSLTEMTMDKEEPAYIYWRLQGDQAPLKGKRQQFRNVSVSITGEVTSIAVPLGSSLQLHARADRKLKEGIRLAEPANRKVSGATTPRAEVRLDADGMGFHTGFKNLTRPHEFEVQFTDLDGVKGRRHVLIEPVDDRGPQEVQPIELAVTLRQPRPAGAPGKAAQVNTLTGFLVTPDALLPFKGTFQDEYGLTDVSWRWGVEEVEFELMGRTPAGKGRKAKEGGLVLGGGAQKRRAGLVVSGLQPPAGLGGGWATPVYWGWLDRLISFDLSRTTATAVFEGSAPLEVFVERLRERDADAIPANVLHEKLRGLVPKSTQLRTHALERTEFFDFRKHLAKLKVRDPAKEAQLHYRVRMFVSATDNNIETGPTRVLNKVPITLLVVSENELLAQILLEEEILRERLEKAVERLKTAKTILDEQVTKLQSPNQQYLSLVGLRADEVRSKLLPDSYSATREVSADYNRILREMEVNRVQEQRVENVDQKICKPLEEVLAPGAGHFAATEGSVQKLWEGVEADVQLLKQAEDAGKKDAKLLEDLEARRPGHLKAAQDAQENMGKLIDRLDAVLQSIGGELVERELIAILLEIERTQRDQAKGLAELYRRLYEEELKGLTSSPTP